MNRAQRLAWFNLRVLTIAGPLCLIALVISLLASELAVADHGPFPGSAQKRAGKSCFR